MKKTSTNKADQDIPLLKREQPSKGVRGKYFQQYTWQSNAVVLKPEILKAFSTSEAVNKAMANMLAFIEATQSLLEVKKRERRAAEADLKISAAENTSLARLLGAKGERRKHNAHLIAWFGR